MKASYIKKEDIQQINENEYLVPSETEIHKFYRVDGRHLICECDRSLKGHICKHLFAIILHFNLEKKDLPPITAADRELMAHLALGKLAPSIDFFQPLHSENAGIPKL